MDIDEFKAFLAKTNYRCGVKNGEPILLRTTNDPAVKFISPEEYLSLKEPSKPASKPAAPKPEKAKAAKPAPEPEVWTRAELDKKTRTQLQAIAKKHDIKANLGTDVLRASLEGMAK